jgi:tetratricopeptide (TPR) repeat protein
MRKLSSGFIIALIAILAFALLAVNRRGIAAANTRSNISQSDAPITLSQIEKLINVPTPDHTVVLSIRRRGIAFTPTEKILARLEGLGAGPETIKELRKYLKPPPSPRPSITPPTSRPSITPPKRDSNPNIITILVANFRGPEPEKYLVADKILQRLVAATSGYSDISIQPLAETITEQTGSKGGSVYARELGTKRNASIVLWGFYGATSEKVDVSVHFEVLRKPKRLFLRQNLETHTLPISALNDFTIQTRLSGEMAYLVLLTVGLARYESGDYDAAIDRFTKALAQSNVPDQIVDPVHIYFYRGGAYYFKADATGLDHAIADFTEVIKLKPDLAGAYSNRGMAYNDKGQHDRAIADFNEAIRLKPDDAAAYANRGVAYTLQEQFDRAIADFTESIRLKPDLAGAYFDRGMAYKKKGQQDHAIADFNEAIRLKPDDPDAYLSRGNVYAKQGQFDRAIADFTEVIKLKPDYSDVYHSRGLAYADQGQQDHAIADFNEAIRLKPNDPEAYLSRGSVYAKQGQFDRAIADFTEVIRLKPDYPKAYFNCGLTYTLQGQFDRAIVDFTEAIRLKPDDPEVYYFRAVAYQHKGEIERAIADLKSILLITNDPEKRRRAEQRLQQLGVK